MFRYITCLCQRPSNYRRSIIFPIVTFMLTTGLLYTLIEHSTFTSRSITSPLYPNSISHNYNCQLRNETVRAIELASTDYCKILLKNISCQVYSVANFFPKSLPRLCPIRNGNFGDVVGCLSTNNNSTYRNETQTFDTDLLCIDYCLKNSVSFAEYNEFTGRCSCLLTFNSEHLLIKSNKKCADLVVNDDHVTNNSATVYRTGFVEFGNHLEGRNQTTTNTPVTIVFFLTVGGRKNLRQIKRLIRIIYTRQHYYLIHIDSRENYLYKQLSILSKAVPNIQLTNKRYPTTWGSSTLLNAHLDAFKQIFEELKWNFTFILNLSETDFPLKPIPILTKFLSIYTSFNFLRSHNRDPFKFIKSQGLFHTFIHCNNYMHRIGPKSLIQNIVYDGGSDWYVLSREFVYYAIYGNDELINGLRHAFNYSLLPCESFFHTVLSNSIYCDTYIRNNLRLVHWNRDRGCKCQHKNFVDWCGCSPLIFRINDKLLLNDTIDKPFFFARKFDPTIDEAIIDWLDEKVSRRNLSQGALYLQNLYSLNDDVSDLNNGLQLIDAYARTILVDYQDYRRHCFRDDTIVLEQIHSVFQLSVFQGYLLQYKFNDGEQFELLMKLNSSVSIDSAQVKRFEVGVDFDSKEIAFTDRGRTFIEPKFIKVLIEWDSYTENDTLLVIYSPIGAVLQRVKLFASIEPIIIDVLFPVVPTTDMIGIWQISIVQNSTENVFASLEFLVFLNNESHSLNTEHLAIIKRFWSLSNMCTTKMNSSLCHDPLYQAKITVTNDCFQQKWSYFSYDVKSDW